MRDLVAEDDFSVLVVDVDPVRLERLTEVGADGVIADLSKPSTVSKAVQDADLVVSEIELALEPGDPSRIRREMIAIMASDGGGSDDSLFSD